MYKLDRGWVYSGAVFTRKIECNFKKEKKMNMKSIVKPKHRFLRKLFYPKNHVNYPKLPAGYLDMITVYSNISFGFWDRIRILLGFTVEIKSYIATENICGKNTSLAASGIVYKDSKHFKFAQEEMLRNLPTCKEERYIILKDTLVNPTTAERDSFLEIKAGEVKTLDEWKQIFPYCNPVCQTEWFDKEEPVKTSVVYGQHCW